MARWRRRGYRADEFERLEALERLVRQSLSERLRGPRSDQCRDRMAPDATLEGVHFFLRRTPHRKFVLESLPVNGWRSAKTHNCSVYWAYRGERQFLASFACVNVACWYLLRISGKWQEYADDHGIMFPPSHTLLGQTWLETLTPDYLQYQWLPEHGCGDVYFLYPLRYGFAGAHFGMVVNVVEHEAGSNRLGFYETFTAEQGSEYDVRIFRRESDVIANVVDMEFRRLCCSDRSEHR